MPKDEFFCKMIDLGWTDEKIERELWICEMLEKSGKTVSYESVLEPTEYVLEIDDRMCFFDDPIPPADEEDERIEKELLNWAKDAIKNSGVK